MKKYIPNGITLINLLAGCITIYALFSDKYEWIVWLVIISLLTDFFDGMVARVLKVDSEIGKQLDSLADLVSFGVVPAVMIVQLLGEQQNVYISLFPFILTIFSAIRLAKFNVDDQQKNEFIGLPTPASSLFVYGLFLSHVYFSGQFDVYMNSVFLMVMIVVLSVLLVVPLPMFSFKFGKHTLKKMSWQGVFLVLAFILLVSFKFAGLSFVITVYVVINIIRNIFSKKEYV